MKFVTNKHSAISIMIGALLVAPFFVLGIHALNLSSSDKETWEFTSGTLLPLFRNSVALVFGTLVCSLLFGLVSSLSTHLTNMPGKKIFAVLHILPLAFPLYIFAFVYLGLLEYSGPLHTFLRELGIDIYQYIPYKSSIGVSFVLGVGLYPYLYLITSHSIKKLDQNLIKIGLSLGKGRKEVLARIILPALKSSLIGALVIIFMETLADFGAVSVFNYDTFTTAIYTAWSSLYSFGVAARLSLILLFITFVILIFEYLNSSKPMLTNRKTLGANFVLFSLSPFQKVLFLVLNSLLLFFSVFLPLGTLILWAIEGLKDEWGWHYLQLGMNSFGLSFTAATLLLIVGGYFSLSHREMKKIGEKLFLKAGLFGYAIPGNVIAVGVFVLMAALTKLISLELTFALSFIALLLGYLVRFLTVSFRNFDSPLNLLSPKIDKSAKSLGASATKMWLKIHLPLLKPILLPTFFLLFLEVFKELPLTLMLRPAEFSTLSVKIYELSAEGEWYRASVGAVFMVGLALILTLILRKKILQGQND